MDMAAEKRTIRLAIAAAIFVGAYIALSPLFLANIFLYLPQRVASYQHVPDEVFGATRQEVTFATPSKNILHGFYFEKPAARYTVLLHHGQGGNLETHFGLARTMLMAGFSVMIYDYEG